ncbi:hypothetical protein ABPG72_017802 [Tetrahymena utriculariae]
MHIDMQYISKEKIPSIKKEASKSDQHIQKDQQLQVHMSKESMVHNPEEIEEGPTLALLLIGNAGFKNMTYLNKKYKKNQHKETEISESSDSLEQEVEVTEEKNKLIDQDANSSDEYKKNKDLEEIFFQTEVVKQENEMEEIHVAVKSYSSVQNSQNIESRQQNDKLQQNSPSNAFNKQQTIQSLKEYNQKFKNSTLLISKSEYRNSNQVSGQSQLINKQSTNLTSNLYIRNSSTTAQAQSNTQHSPIADQQQKIVTAEEKPFQTSKKKKKFSSQPHKLKFRWLFFMEFLLYHLIYYCFFGPLSVLIILYAFKQNFAICHNMGFVGFNFISIYQAFQYIFYVISILIYFNIPKTLQSQYLIFFLSFLYIYIIKILIMTLKYGFYTHNKMKEIRSQMLKDDYIKESIFGGWYTQSEEIIKEEIENAKLRLEVESSSFYFEFMTKPTTQQLQKLLAPERKKQILTHNGNKFDITQLPYGINLLMEYIKYYKNQFPTNWIKKVSYSISIVRQVYFIYVKVQCVMQVEDNTMYLINLIAVNIFFAFFEFTFWGQIISILLIYFNDLRRKVFILNQMSHLISPKRVEIELEGTKKLYPTLELICPISLRTWAQLRKMTLDYGEKFSQRIQILVSIFISFFIIITVIYLLQRFQVINFFNIQNNVAYLYVFDIICIILIIIKCVFMGGKINEHFSIHIQKLYANQLNFVELLSKYDLWFQDDYVLTNPCFRRLIEDYQRSKISYNFSDKQLKKLIKDNIQLCKMQILDINIQSKDNPYKVFGVAMTQQLGFTILTALISLIGSLFIKLIYSNPSAMNLTL